MTPENAKPASPAGLPPKQGKDFAETTVARQDTEAATPRPEAEPATAQAWVGKTLGKYQVTSVLGQGGMGVVLKARDPMIERDVAIKVLAAHWAANQSSLDRFLGEAKAVGKLNHANVCAIYEIGQEGSNYFLVMEHVPGGSLSERLDKHGACSVLEATRAMIDACQGLAAAHAAGLVHRDIKPANFMRGADGTVKVMDFGLAKSTAGESRTLTQAGMVVGTPFYMSPEQCEARPVDARSDVYSLGATYYSLLTGKHPFQNSDSVPQLMYLHCHGPIPDPRALDSSIPEACTRIISRAMAKSPDERYQTAGAMLADLQAVSATLPGQSHIILPSEHSGPVPMGRTQAMPGRRPPGSRRRLALIGGGIGLLIAAGVTLALWQPWHSGADDATGGAAAGAEPIKVGILHSLSGTMAASGTSVTDATLYAIEEVNQAGGVLGRPIKAVVADGGSDWANFAREAERLITEEQATVIFGCWTSAGRKSVKPVVEQHDHLLIYPVQYEGVENSPCIVYMGAAPNQQIIPAVQWAVGTLHKKRFFLVGSDYVFPRTAHEIIKDQLKALGVELAGEQFIPLGSPLVQSAVEAIVRTKPDMILNTVNGDTNNAFFRALRAAGVKSTDVPTLSFSVGEQELRGLRIADMQGDYAAWTYFQSVATPENETFVRKFREEYPQRTVTDPMEAAYVGVKLWARAAEEAKSLTPKQVRRALLNQRFPAPGGELRIDPDTQHCFKTPRIGQIQANGQFKIVWAAAAPVAPDPYPSTRTAAEWRAFLHDLYTGWGNRWAAPEKVSP